MMKYETVHPSTKDEAEVALVQRASAEITNALLGVTYSIKDWRWVQTACLNLLNGSNPQIQWVAIRCLGHLATFHRTLDLALVLPVLQALEANQKLSGVVSDAFDDIAMTIKCTSELVESWGELPQRVKEVLVEEDLFDGHGKRIKKRRCV